MPINIKPPRELPRKLLRKLPKKLPRPTGRRSKTGFD
jgi:hypothetical protein